MATPTPAECNQLATLFNAGHYVGLESQSRLLIKRYPESVLAWDALRASLQAQGKDALPAFQKAAELLPDDASAHYNLGIALQEHGRLDDAMASYRRALEIKPDLAMAHNNLANTLKDLGRLDDAVASYRRALEIKPDLAMTHSNMGNVLQDLGQLDDAMASYRRALEIQPDFALAHCNLGVILQDLGLLDDAVASYRQALEIQPDLAMTHFNLGVTLKDLGRIDDAVVSYCRALEIKPDFTEAHYNLGNTLKDLGQLNDAVASYRRALVIDPNFSGAHNNLGNALKDLGLLDDAVASYRRALEIKPDFTDAHSNLLFVHNYLSDQPAAALLAEARRFGDLAARLAPPYTDWLNITKADRCLRVGLVSGDFRAHPVGYFIEGMLAALASSTSGRLELIAYSTHFCADAVTERIKACCHSWHSVAGLSDKSLAQQVHDDGINILIDLSGHTAHNRLQMFALKPAPVQVTWLGYLATTGVAAMDYLIADSWTLPKTDEAYFTEKIWRLPETYLCFTPPVANEQVAPLPALTNGHITFGCFNNLTKMNNNVVALWARVLAAVPDSRLFLKTKQLDDASVQKNIVERFAVHGIGFDRLILKGYVPRAEYLALYQQVDIALDPFPYPGITTSVESLWMGVPMLTLAGQSFLSRQGVGLLMNAGLPDWIAADTDDYIAKAVSHAGDLQQLAALRSVLRQQVLASPIFDAPSFARHFEAALRGMWVQWCDQQ